MKVIRLFKAVKKFLTVSSTAKLPDLTLVGLKTVGQTFKVDRELYGVLVKGFGDSWVVKVFDEKGEKPYRKSYLLSYKEPSKDEDSRKILIEELILDYDGLIKVNEYSYLKKQDDEV